MPQPAGPWSTRPRPTVGEQPLEAAHLSGAPQERSACASGLVRHAGVERRVGWFHAVSSMSETPDPLVTVWATLRLLSWKSRMRPVDRVRRRDA